MPRRKPNLTTWYVVTRYRDTNEICFTEFSIPSRVKDPDEIISQITMLYFRAMDYQGQSAATGGICGGPKLK